LLKSNTGNVFHLSYILLLTSFTIRMMSNGIFVTGNISFLLLSSLLILTSFLIYIKYKKTEYAVLILFIFLTIFLFLQPSIPRASFLVLLFTLYVLRNCNLKFTVNILLLFSISFIFIVFCLVATGIIENRVIVSEAGRRMYSLGFENPNSPSLFLGSTLMVAAYAIKLHNKNKSIQIFFILTASVVVYFIVSVTGTRTLAMTWAVFCFTTIFRKVFINALTIKIIRLLPVLILIAFHLMAMNYTNNIVIAIDDFLTNRIIHYAYYLPYFSTIDIIFGNAQLAAAIAYATYGIQNAYGSMLLSNGAIAFFIFFFLYRKSINYRFSKKDYTSISIILFYLIYAITENIFLNISFFPDLIFWILISRVEPISK